MHTYIKLFSDQQYLISKIVCVFVAFFPFLEPIMNYFNLGQPVPYSNTMFIATFITKVLDERERSNTVRLDHGENSHRLLGILLTNVWEFLHYIF